MARLGLQDPYVLPLDTFARSDAFFLGVAAACAGSRVAGPAPPGRRRAGAPSGVVLASSFVSTDQHLAAQLPWRH